MSRVVPLALLVLAAACGERREITLQVLVPDLAGIATPIGGVVVAAIPYDRDSVIAAMEARATTPRPHTRTLDSLFHAFHGPFLAFSRAAWAVEQATRTGDSAKAARLRPEMERTRAELSAARDTLWPRIESLRVQARQWQVSTFAGYDTAARSLARSRMRTLSADTTDATGWATLRVAPGPWWITARSPDPQDPNFEWYWNVRVDADTVRLDPASGRHLPRY
ncbi:MAG TPA: hypothetical protein VIQ98_02040 [Gemmatimonadales bacterium]|jgi:hypothetical protein